MNAILSVPAGLPALEQRLRQDLEWLEWPARDWVPPREHEGQPVRDVVIVGAGMCGLAAGAALKGLGLSNIVLFDRAPAGREGPGSPMPEWRRCARRSSSPARRWDCRR